MTLAFPKFRLLDLSVALPSHSWGSRPAFFRTPTLGASVAFGLRPQWDANRSFAEACGANLNDIRKIKPIWRDPHETPQQSRLPAVSFRFS